MDKSIIEEIFPEPEKIFEKENATLEQSLNDGIIVLDTNTLLFPYCVNKQSLNEIITLYKKLVKDERLYIPAHVAREFAKNRTKKLGEIYSEIEKMCPTQSNIDKYPLLADIEEYGKIIQYKKDIEQIGKEMKKNIKNLLVIIDKFGRNDPVSVSYHELFSEKQIVSPSIPYKELMEDLDKRNKNNIPPGYKDKGKDHNREGDLLIWHTILKLGEEFNKDLVFISQDGKSDWQYNVNKKPFQPRYELIDEYRRYSKGKSFHIAPLSKLLEHFDISKSILRKIERFEGSCMREKLSKLPKLKESTIEEIISEMKKWFLSNYEPPENNLPYESAEGGYIYIWGGPYDLEEELNDRFGDDVSENIIKLCAEIIEQEYDCIEWSKIPPNNNNLWVEIDPDYETGERAGAGGTFQVISITDQNDNDLTRLVDQGQHYHSVEDVLKDLSKKLGIDVDGELV